MSESELFKQGNSGNKDIAVITFGGCAAKFGGILPFEFVGIISKNYPEIDTFFYVDQNMVWYNKGLKGLTSNVEETAERIKSKVSDYRKVVCIGNSAGGYGSLLFSSLIEADVCLSFNPQTDLNHVQEHLPKSYTYDRLEDKYRDIIPHLNSKTDYQIYTQNITKDIIHHRYHTDRISELNKPNVQITEINSNIKGLRDSGRLKQILDYYLKDAGIHEG